MGKAKNAPKQASNEARAVLRMYRSSPQKLNLVAQTIRGKSAARAITDLQFSKRRVAGDVKKLLESAVANAENNHGLDVDRLVVSEATVGKTMKMKRFRARARGRSASIEKKFSNMTIVVKEQEA